MALRQYDPKQISLIVGGKIITGYADGTFVTPERNEDAFMLKVGVDGEGSRSKNANKSGKITIVLMQTSPSNDYLSALALADELSGNGVVPALMKDNLGTTLVTALSAWVKKIANPEMAKEVGTRTWVIETDELNMLVGGN